MAARGLIGFKQQLDRSDKGIIGQGCLQQQTTGLPGLEDPSKR